MYSRSGIGCADTSNSPSTTSRFRKSGFAVALGVTAAVASAPLQTANAAAIYYSGPLNISAAINETINVTSADKTLFSFTNATSDKGGGASLYISPNGAPDVKAKFVALSTTVDNGKGSVITTLTLTDGHQLTANYGTGVSISATSIYGTDSTIYFDYKSGPNALAAPADFYVGLQVTITNTISGSALIGLNYGWAHFSVGAGHTPFTLVDYAFSNSVPILTGAVPEPTSMALVGLGATGLLARRRRRVPSATA